MTAALSLSIFPALMAFAAASDLVTMTISNRIALGLIAGFAALALVIGMSPEVVATHVAAGAVVLAIGFTCFAFGWIGGGDAKLAAATALWFGFDQLMNYLLLASVLGGALTLLIIQFRKWPLPRALHGQDWIMRLHRADAGVPYGIALAVAALLVYPDTPFMKAIGF
jgi:prepilin peptidase CpaA